MNSRQKRICGTWHQLLLGFAQREWFSLFLSSSLGVVAAEVVELLSRDHSFQNDLVTHYLPKVSFDDPQHHIPYLTIIFGTMILAVAVFMSVYIWRGLKSWSGQSTQLMYFPIWIGLGITSYVFARLGQRPCEWQGCRNSPFITSGRPSRVGCVQLGCRTTLWR